MLNNLDVFARRYFASAGSSALEGVGFEANFGDFDVRKEGTSARPISVPTDTARHLVSYPGWVVIRDSSVRVQQCASLGGSTVVIDDHVDTNASHDERLSNLIHRFVEIGTQACIARPIMIDALKILSKIPRGLRLPEFDIGDEEILFEWNDGEYSAIGSVEGDGLFGYALKIDGVYVPGTGPENVNSDSLPDDLLKYLRKTSC